MNELSIN